MQQTFINITYVLCKILFKYILAEKNNPRAIITNIRKNRIKMRDTERLLASYTDKLVKAKKLRKHYTMQTLRHAAISYMLMGGASKDEVASYTGVTGKWMNRYDKIIADNVINVAANYNVININLSKIDKNVSE